MTEATRAAIEFGFGRLGLHRIQARCLLPDIASARVMEKVGMQFESVLRGHFFAKGTFHDVKLYAILQGDI